MFLTEVNKQKLVHSFLLLTATRQSGKTLYIMTLNMQSMTKGGQKMTAHFNENGHQGRSIGRAASMIRRLKKIPNPEKIGEIAAVMSIEEKAKFIKRACGDAPHSLHAELISLMSVDIKEKATLVTKVAPSNNAKAMTLHHFPDVGEQAMIIANIGQTHGKKTCDYLIKMLTGCNHPRGEELKQLVAAYQN